MVALQFLVVVHSTGSGLECFGYVCFEDVSSLRTSS